MPPAAPAKGNILTRKFGPLPGWAWAGIGVGAYLVYKQRKAASAAAAAAPATTSTAAATPIAQAPSGYGYQGPAAGGGGPGWNVGTPPPTASSYVADPNASLFGSGYGNPATNKGTSTSGTNYENLSWASAQPLINGGQTVFFEPAPGVFQPATAGGGLIPGLSPGTPLYIPTGQ